MLASYCSSKDGKAIADGIHGSKSFWERYNYLKDDLDGKVLVDGLGVCSPEGLQELLEGAKKYSGNPEYKDAQKLLAETAALLKDQIPAWKDAESFWKEASAVARQGLAKQIEALLINPQVSGYILDTWSDYGLNFAGLVNWLRKPKSTLETVKKVNRPIHVIAEAEDRTPYIGTSAAIKIHMVNDGHLGDYGLLLRVKGPNGRIWHQESLPGKAKPGVNLVGRFKFPVGFEKGRFTFDLNLSKNNKEMARTEEVFLVPPEAKLEVSLKAVSMLGNFPDTVSSFHNPDAHIRRARRRGHLAGRRDQEALREGRRRRHRHPRQPLRGGCAPPELPEGPALRGGLLPVLRQHLRQLPLRPGRPGVQGPAFGMHPGSDLCGRDALLEPGSHLRHVGGRGQRQPARQRQGKNRLRWGADIATMPLGKGKGHLLPVRHFRKAGEERLGGCPVRQPHQALVRELSRERSAVAGFCAIAG